MTSTYKAFIIVNVNWADGSFWNSSETSKHGNLGAISCANAKDVPSAIKSRLHKILGIVRDLNAKTSPVNYNANGFIDATYADERKARKNFNHSAEKPEEFAERLHEKVEQFVKELVAIGSDDI